MFSLWNFLELYYVQIAGVLNMKKILLSFLFLFPAVLTLYWAIEFESYSYFFTLCIVSMAFWICQWNKGHYPLKHREISTIYTYCNEIYSFNNIIRQYRFKIYTVVIAYFTACIFTYFAINTTLIAVKSVFLCAYTCILNCCNYTKTSMFFYYY